MAHKSLRGPRSSMIFYRKSTKPAKKGQPEGAVYDYEDKFPSLQGGPHNHQIDVLVVALKQAAQDIAVAGFATTHPIRLGLALNFSMFYSEFLDSPNITCNLVKQDSGVAIAEVLKLTLQPHYIHIVRHRNPFHHHLVLLGMHINQLGQALLGGGAKLGVLGLEVREIMGESCVALLQQHGGLLGSDGYGIGLNTNSVKLAIEVADGYLFFVMDKHNESIQSEMQQKGSESPLQLNTVHEDLKKARDKLALVEQEKTQALKELKEAKRLADEASKKLKIEIFRADEPKQAGIDTAHKKEDEWQKELENIQNQHAKDLATLLSSTQELQRVKHELMMTVDAKNPALSHADDAMKIVEINAEKVMVLSAKVNRLKTMLDTMVENMSTKTAELVKKLDCKVGTLKSELESAKAAEDNLIEMEAMVQSLKIEVDDTKRAETDACNLLDELKRKAELLEDQFDKAEQSKKSSRDALATVSKQLEERNALLQDAKYEISVLIGKVGSLEEEVTRHKVKSHLDVAKQEALELGNTIEILTSELQIPQEEDARCASQSFSCLAATPTEILLRRLFRQDALCQR